MDEGIILDEPRCTCVAWDPCLCGMPIPHCRRCGCLLPDECVLAWLECMYGDLRNQDENSASSTGG